MNGCNSHNQRIGSALIAFRESLCIGCTGA
nr:MAG TPA: hypothetical protein [Caudoviricetes sp.]